MTRSPDCRRLASSVTTLRVISPAGTITHTMRSPAGRAAVEARDLDAPRADPIAHVRAHLAEPDQTDVHDCASRSSTSPDLTPADRPGDGTDRPRCQPGAAGLSWRTGWAPGGSGTPRGRRPRATPGR